LLIGTLMYQFSDNGKRVIIDVIGWRLPLLMLLNATYLVLWSHFHHLLAFFAAVHVSVLICNIYFVVKRENPPKNVEDEVFIHLPISMWHAWTTFVLVQAGFEAFGSAQDRSSGSWESFFTVLSIISLELVSAAYAFSSPEGDLAGSIVISWAFLGLVERQGNDGFRIAAVISLVWVAKAAYGLYCHKFKHTNGENVVDSERAPLIGSA